MGLKGDDQTLLLVVDVDVAFDENIDGDKLLAEKGASGLTFNFVPKNLDPRGGAARSMLLPRAARGLFQSSY